MSKDWAVTLWISWEAQESPLHIPKWKDANVFPRPALQNHRRAERKKEKVRFLDFGCCLTASYEKEKQKVRSVHDYAEGQE